MRHYLGVPLGSSRKNHGRPTGDTWEIQRRPIGDMTESL